MFLSLPSLTGSYVSPYTDVYRPSVSIPITEQLQRQPVTINRGDSQDVGKFSLGNAAQGGVSGAAQGGTIGGGYGAVIGGVLGALTSAWADEDKTAANPTGQQSAGGGGGGLVSAFSSGLGSLGGGVFDLSSTQTNVQTQEVSNDTNVNVNNILGGRTFGEFDAQSGNFDTLRLIGDVFAIKSAQDAESGTSQQPIKTVTQQVAAPNVIDPKLLVAGGALLLLFMLTRKK